MKRELKFTNTGTAPEIELKSSVPLIILEINTGFGTHEFGGVKAALIAKRTNEDWDSYFAAGVTVPSPGGDHASIFSWHGCKFWDANRYNFKVVGAPYASDTMYVDIVIDDEIEKYLGAGVHIGGSVFAHMAPGGYAIDQFAALGAVDDKKFEVPSNRRWVSLGAFYAERDQNATFTARVMNDADKCILYLDTFAAGTSNIQWPFSASAAAASYAANAFKGFVLKPGDYLFLQWGATQTTPEVSFPVLVIPQ